MASIPRADRQPQAMVQKPERLNKSQPENQVASGDALPAARVLCWHFFS
jgi:hypothetical protein